MNFSFPTIFSEHKHFEFSFQWRSQICKWIELSFSYKEKCDHAGLYFVFSFLKLFFIEFSIYDDRHWNYNEDRWASFSEWIHQCHRGECSEKLGPLFTKEDADKLLTDAIYAEAKIVQMFLNVKNNSELANQFYIDISQNFSDLKDWLRKLIYRKKAK